MTLTEPEAKTKWCAFARLEHPLADTEADADIAVCAVNRQLSIADTAGACDANPDQMNPPAARCIASACMSWRWAKHNYSVSDRGYCGLAGKAEIE